MPLSTYLENKILYEVFGKVDYVAPTTLYLGLSTTTPAKGGTGVTEPSGGAYARVPITNNATNFPASTASSKANGAVFTFAEATAAWGTISHWVIYDAASVGNMIVFGTVATPKAIDIGDTPSFNTGTLTITMS
jgi:hypothetical protein